MNKESESRQRHMTWMGKSVLIYEHYTRVSRMDTLEIRKYQVTFQTEEDKEMASQRTHR